MTVEARERARLRADRERLQRTTAALYRESERLQQDEATDDAIRDLSNRLTRHQHDLETFHKALEQFHALYGPLGD